MTDVQNLSQFTLTEAPEGYLLEIGGDGGAAVNLNVTAQQVDAIIDALDDVLAEDDASADEV